MLVLMGFMYLTLRKNISTYLFCPLIYVRCPNPVRFINKLSFNPFGKKKFRTEELDSKITNRICITVLGNGAYGNPRCLGIFTDFKDYIFNCGEGIGRLFREHEINLINTRHIFITHKSWINLSGVGDFYLTHSAYGIRKFYLHGPPGIEEFKKIVQSYNNDLRIRKIPHDGPPYIDETLQIESIPIKPKTSSDNNDLVISYLCKIHDKPGEFLPERCIEYGIPIGNELFQLKNGASVTLSSGRVVHSKDVHSEDVEGLSFLVVECPSEKYLDSFVENKKFQLFQLPSESAFNISAVFHFTPSSIIDSTKYQEWMNRFHQNTNHFILNSKNFNLNSEAIHKTQHALHLLHPKIFPIFHEVEPTINKNLLPSISQAPSFLQIHVRPAKKISWENVIKLKPYEYIEEVKSIPGFNEELKKLKNLLNSHQICQTKKPFPQIIFLGTSSSTSTACRNVSAILVITNPRNAILLDSGEGTFNQLVRYFGYLNVGTILKKISCIFVSHMHYDHYLGLFEFIKRRKEAFESSRVPYRPLNLILPHQVEYFLKSYDKIFEPLAMYTRIFSCSDFVTKKSMKSNSLKKHVGDIEICTVPVKHCLDAYGVVLNYASDWKLVYSGDTAPAQSLIEAGKNCNLLIHEASLEDEYINEASARLHSTPSQVIQISEMMNAQYTIMTHFSKRYLNVPVFYKGNHDRIGCAFDFMTVHLHDLPVLSLFFPILKCLFQELLENYSEKASNLASHENVCRKVFLHT